MIVAVVYGPFAPFHLARLEAAGDKGQKEGHQLVGIEVAATQSDYKWPRLASPGKHYHHVTLFPGWDYWDLSYRQIRKALGHTLEQARPDVVVLPGWGFKESLAGLGWCLRRGVARVLVSDSQPHDTPQRVGRQLAKRVLVSRFQAGLAGGRPHIRYLAQLGLPPGHCFPGCDVVDNQWFADASGPPRKNRMTPDERPVLLSCLRLLPRKNVLGVLETLAYRPDWDWTLVGDGPQRDEIAHRVKDLRLEERVRLLGHVDYFQLPSIYAQADIYLQPSLSEPWGLAVNEAMACGLPVVVSDRCGCCEDLVEEDMNGCSFDPQKPGGLATALDSLLACRDRWQEMGQASRQIISRWGPELYASNLWRACQTAQAALPQGRIKKALSTALGAVL